MKFDFAIGNPPYQDNAIGENDTYAPPVYNKFLDAAYAVADSVEMIHPATKKKEREKETIEDGVRDHLRGFSRTIPSFLMAYGDNTVTRLPSLL